MTKIILTEDQIKSIVIDEVNHIEETYFETFSSAVQYARESTENRGYEIVENSWWNEISVGQGRPKEGKTHKFTIELTRNGKPQKKYLHIIIYNRGNDVKRNYELTYYIG